MMKGYCDLCKCYIKESTVFSDLTDEEIEATKRIVRTFRFAKKAVIFHEGEECKGLYVLKKGMVKLLRVSREGKEQIIDLVEPGGLLGVEILYNAPGHSTTAIAMEDCEVCFISKENFEDLLEVYPSIARNMIRALSRELDNAYTRIGLLGLLTAKQRLAHLLYTIATEQGYRNGKARLKLPLSRHEIGELLGITQETSIRLLRSLKEDGIIDIKGKEIIIPSLYRLKTLAEM